MSIGTLRPEQGPPTFPLECIESDGVPLESEWHILAMSLLFDVTCYWMRDTPDYFVGGNMFIYFNSEQKLNQDFRGPDYFFVRGISRSPARPCWKVWEEEGRFPDVIMELGSRSTIREDKGTKKELYEKTFRTPEYFIFDPASKSLQGWRLVNERYESIVPNEHGWLWSEQLQAWIGIWEGEYRDVPGSYPRLFDEQGRMVPTGDERAEMEALRGDREQKKAAAERKRAQVEKLRAEAEKQRADAEATRAAEERQRADAEATRAAEERQRADAEATRAAEERQRADAEATRAAEEKLRADAAEAEIARLRALLPKGKQGPA